ncbi:MAG: bifunctional enzyme CysN/CysC [Gammaproteobacteria bacterium]|jgi:bifunctional enzyme CysN/CysC
MSHASSLIADDIDAYLAQHERKELLRFLTCGSVDDGKSTLIGRLLYDSKMLYEDQLAALRRESATVGTNGGDFDPALVTDGLKAEREQGITIDVAYRYFSTAKRKFIIADTPGHEQFTRNMATGASNCDLAVILIDARYGVVTQTRRHSFIVSLLGIKHVVVAVNKMDLVDFQQDVFTKIQADFSQFVAKLDIRDVSFIPMSALNGDNVVDPSANLPWYQGSTLMHYIENVHIASDRNLVDFRLPIQYVNRPNQNFRGYCGTVASGIVRPGDEVVVLPSRVSTRIEAIHTFEGPIDQAHAAQAITVTLADEVDISRGDVLAHPGNLPRIDDRVEAMVVWMAEEPLVPGKRYGIKHQTRFCSGVVRQVRYLIDVNSLHRQDASALRLNEIGRCSLEFNQPLVFDAYTKSRMGGAFIVIDQVTNGTVGAGMIIDRASHESRNDHWDTEPRSDQLHRERSPVSAVEREARFGQKAVTLLLTGLSGSGKTTLASALERALFDLGHAACVLDGQSMRVGLSRDLGFTSEDRSEAMRRGAETARLMNDAGLVCICGFMAPSHDVRERARAVVGNDRWLVVHVHAPVEVCRERDTDGVYARADAGEIGMFPGVSMPYEEPRSPDLLLDTSVSTPQECVEQLLTLLREHSVIE